MAIGNCDNCDRYNVPGNRGEAGGAEGWFCHVCRGDEFDPYGELDPHEPANVSVSECELMLHTLGLNRAEQSYRNFFVAAPGHDDWDLLDRLCFRGLMRIGSRINEGRDTVFCVTELGKSVLPAAKTHHEATGKATGIWPALPVGAIA